MAKQKSNKTIPKNDSKIEQLMAHTLDSSGKKMLTNTGLAINDDQNSLKAGDRGATLLEDFILREKITHFDHERIRKSCPCPWFWGTWHL